MTTIPSDAGLTTPPIAVERLSRDPISTPDTTSTTSIPSSTGVSLPTRKVSGHCGPTAISQTASTIVCTAIPPIRLPAAKSRCPPAAAETVIAISGRVPATASSRMPPSSWPRPRRASSASVVFESATPAAHIAAAPAAKTRMSSGVARLATWSHSRPAARGSHEQPLLEDVDRARGHEQNRDRRDRRLGQHERLGPPRQGHRISRAEGDRVRERDVEVVHELGVPPGLGQLRVLHLRELEVRRPRIRLEPLDRAAAIESPVPEAEGDDGRTPDGHRLEQELSAAFFLAADQRRDQREDEQPIRQGHD